MVRPSSLASFATKCNKPKYEGRVPNACSRQGQEGLIMQPSAANVQILIVEDDPDIGKLLALTMRESGMTPTIAAAITICRALLPRSLVAKLVWFIVVSP